MSSDIDEPKSLEKLLNRTPFASEYNYLENLSIKSPSPRTSLDLAKINSKQSSVKQFQKLTWDEESYEGTVVLNNLHGFGFYTNRKNNRWFYYSGLFYLNSFEGYGQVFYSDGSHYQGLFKRHKRYGPGILTYSDGSRDVGIWNGFKLIRLSTVIGNNVVTLARTPLGRSTLLSYKYLIPIEEKTSGFGNDLLKALGANKEVLKHSSQLTNNNINNPNSLFFNQKLFDDQFYIHHDCTIRVLQDDEEHLVSPEQSEEELSQEEDAKNYNGIAFFLDILNSKIREMKEKVKPLFSIRKNLQERINCCKDCCYKENVEEEKNFIDVELKSETIESVKSFDFTDYEISRIHVDQIEAVEENSEKVVFPSTSVDSCICEEEYHIDDLQHLEDQLANITKQAEHYQTIVNNLQKQVEKVTVKYQKCESKEQKTRKVSVSELWAWNNEPALMDIQKHCFRNRNFEDMVNFNVASLIFGNRKEFGEVGSYENLCRMFLIACSKGNKNIVLRSLRENVHPNVSDARGNNGVFFASSENQLEIIPLLANYGANLDHINDEGLTPLSHTLLRYLSVKNFTSDWEKAFLSQGNPRNIPDLSGWYQMKSFLSLSSMSSKTSMEQGSLDLSNSRIKVLFRKLSNIQHKESVFSIRPYYNDYIFNLKYKDRDTNRTNNADGDEEYENELKSIYLTLMTLLEYGTDPNSAEVPYSPLVLALFTENPDIVQQLLECNADSKITITSDNLSCLHVVSSINKSLENIKICQLLLQNECDPNIRTGTEHWKEQRNFFIGSVPEGFDVEDSGKNSLHLLCMRQDFEDDSCEYFTSITRLFIEFGTDVTATYLGHTALSLAILVGNIDLIRYLIKSNVFDPYFLLPHGMGNIVTLHALKRFENHLSIDRCKDILKMLFEIDVNFLDPIGEAENVVSFIEQGDVLFKHVDEKLDKKSGKPKAQKKVDKHSQGAVLNEFIKTLSRETIIKKIQMYVTDVLYDFTEEGMLDSEEKPVILAEFLTPDVVLINIKYLLHYGSLSHDRFDQNLCLKLLEFVNVHKKVTKAKTDHSAREKKIKGTTSTPLPEETMKNLLLKANFPQSAIILPTKNVYIVKPGLDDPSKYKVCFHCLKGRNKELKTCPRCEQIYFCSSQCNKLNLKLKTPHHCQILFYDLVQDTSNTQKLSELALKVKEKCLKSLFARREAKLKEEEEHLIQMWKTDIYGTKFLKLRALLKKTKDSREVKWNLAGLQALFERNYKKIPAGLECTSIEIIRRKLSQSEKIQSLSSFKSRSGHQDEQSQKTTEALLERTIIREEKPHSTKIKRRRMKNEAATTVSSPENEKLSKKFANLNVGKSLSEKGTVIKKLRKIPPKFQRFVETLTVYFPDIDFSFSVLPFACCTEGQLYYRFCDNDYFRESYSFS